MNPPANPDMPPPNQGKASAERSSEIVSAATVPAAGPLGVRHGAGPGNASPVPSRLLYAQMLMARRFDLRFERLRLAGRLAKWYSAIGHEASTVPAGLALRPGDALCSLHRDLGAILSYYLDPREIFPEWADDGSLHAERPTDWPPARELLRRLACQLLGKAPGYSHGIERSFHYGFFAADDALRHVGMISHLGSMIPVAAGCAYWLQQQGKGGVAFNFIGDGGTSTGDFHEGLNFAAVWGLPMVLMIENNQYAFSTPTSDQYAAGRLSDRALGYGMFGETVDGNDPEAVWKVVRAAVERARSGQGPTLIEAVVGRMRGHAEGDDSMKIVPEEDRERYLAEDPLPSYRQRLLDRSLLSVSEIEQLEARIDEWVEDAVDFALAADPPAPQVARRPALAATSLAAGPPGTAPLRIRRRTLEADTSYVDAVRHALHDALEGDERPFLLGQDIGAFEGPFRTTRGLHARWPDRVRDTPIAESGTVGLSVGAALLGSYPVIEMQFADFVSCGFNQIVNVAAKMFYRFERPCPVVVRLPSGGGVGAGAFHSQNPEGWFAHVAGLKVVCPSTAEDAYHLLCDAIEDPNPVIYCEHKFLYRRERVARPTSPEERLPLGRAAVRRRGDDLSLIAYGASVGTCLEVADTLEQEGISCEVVDLRSLVPLDLDTVLETVRRTHRVLVVHEAQGTAGFGAEVVAQIADEAFEWLDAPVRRVTHPDLPVPFVKALERELLPGVERVTAAARELLRY